MNIVCHEWLTIIPGHHEPGAGARCAVAATQNARGSQQVGQAQGELVERLARIAGRAGGHDGDEVGDLQLSARHVHGQGLDVVVRQRHVADAEAGNIPTYDLPSLPATMACNSSRAWRNVVRTARVTDQAFAIGRGHHSVRGAREQCEPEPLFQFGQGFRNGGNGHMGDIRDLRQIALGVDHDQEPQLPCLQVDFQVPVRRRHRIDLFQ